jgi:hypothetical protein
MGAFLSISDPQRVCICVGEYARVLNNTERATLTIDLSDYAIVNGIQMPSKQKPASGTYALSLFKSV